MRSTRRFSKSARWIACVTLVWCAVALADDDAELKKELGDEVDSGWIYDDVKAGYAKAQESGKPLLVAFR